MKKRILAMLVVLCMGLTMIPMGVFASVADYNFAHPNGLWRMRYNIWTPAEFALWGYRGTATVIEPTDIPTYPVEHYKSLPGFETWEYEYGITQHTNAGIVLNSDGEYLFTKLASFQKNTWPIDGAWNNHHTEILFTKIALPEGIVAVESFAGQTSLAEVYLPDSLVSFQKVSTVSDGDVELAIFKGCASLATVVFGTGFTTFPSGKKIFEGVDGVDLYFRSDTPPTMSGAAFDGSATINIHYPTTANAAAWSTAFNAVANGATINYASYTNLPVGAQPYYGGGAPADEEITLSFDDTNDEAVIDAPTAGSAVLIIASYSSTGSLVDVYIDDAYDVVASEDRVGLPSGFDKGASVKVMLWNIDGTPVPLAVAGQ